MDFQNQTSMPVVYRMADIFILPSQGPGETWGLAVNEAMASGCAIMMSDKAGGAVDLIQEGRNGIIFRSGDILKCKDFINQILANRIALREMKEASRLLISKFSFENIVSKIETLSAGPVKL
jgi:glycosyltransferase involved in cell wall biosynthesis